MTPSLEKTNKENSEQADSNDVASFKETNKLFLDSNNSSITDIIEPESKNINNNTAQLRENSIDEVIPEQQEEKDNIHDELDHEIDEEEINVSSDGFNQTHNTKKSIQDINKDDNNEDSINLTIGEDDINLFADEEDTNIGHEDEVIEIQTNEETSLVKQRESRHPITDSSSRATTGLVKSHRSATEKQSSVGDKPHSIHKEDKDIRNSKPIISVSVTKDEKKEEEKQVKEKVEAVNKQSYDSKTQQISNDTSIKNNSSLVHNIWVSGLSSITKATDLKQLFSNYGKVVSAKVVTNAKTPGARCYGFVTLSSAEDSNRSIANLHQTELHDRIISVERAKRDYGYQVTDNISDTSKVNGNSENDQKTKKTEERKDKQKEKRPEITINGDKKPDLSTLQHSSQDQNRSKIMIETDVLKKDRSFKSKSNQQVKEMLRELERERECFEKEKRKQQEIINLNKVKNEQERLKQKECEKLFKEVERKGCILKMIHLETDRRHKKEAIWLQTERQKLKIKRERLKKQTSVILRFKYDHQRLERERLQREKEELLRARDILKEIKRQELKRAMSPSMYNKRQCSSNSSRYEERKVPIRSFRIQPSSDYMNQGLPPPTITRHHYEQYSSDNHRMRPSSIPPSSLVSRFKESTVNTKYAVQPATDHHYRCRYNCYDRRDESQWKDSSSGGSNRHAYTSYDSNKSSYGISRNSENNTWPSVLVKSSYGTFSSSSETNNAVLRSNPWTNTKFQELETIWPHPFQPSPNKWVGTSSNPISINERNSSSNALYDNNYQEVIPNSGLNISTSYSDSRFHSYKMSGMSRKY